MRPKIILCAILVFITAFVTLSRLRTVPRTPAQNHEAEPKEQATPVNAVPTFAPRPAPVDAKDLAHSAATNTVPAQEAHDRAVEKRGEELMALAMQDDAASLGTILSELDNADPAIRAAALQATVQFGSRDAIPRLMEAAQKTEDRQERRAIEDAVEYLKLPSLTEVRAERRQLVTH